MLGFAAQLAQARATLAAVDLGSNSFHLIVARLEDGQLHVIDRLREMVQLAGGFDAQKNLTQEAQERALNCLSRFAERLRDLPPGAVRAVGTNTLRRARNGNAFRLLAERALGHPIEVIAGREEARLVYLGVAHGLAGDKGRRLVIDIGGGSTEFIIGEGVEPLYRESLLMGCVSMSQGVFADGRITDKRMRQAELAARVQLEPIETSYRRMGWDTTVGSSGTIKAIGAIVEAEGWSQNGISRAGMARLRQAMVDVGDVNALTLAGLKDERRLVLAGGFAVLNAAFEALAIEHMQVSDMALREGVLYDLVGRIRHEDVRERTVSRLATRIGVDAEQARRVEATALDFLRQVSEPWGLPGEVSAEMLAWAARLHEIGLVISHNQHHKHGGYLLLNADLAGFSRQEQAVLAALVRGHRRKISPSAFEVLEEGDRQPAVKLCLLLRLAVLLHRGRRDDHLPALSLKIVKSEPSKLKLRFPQDWLEGHPLTAADLEQEATYLKAAGFKLKAK
jgi:exopolyphosphatase/guanosine-5'-triphosphate,3'-diphosphate pyrophosphatase